MSEEYEGKQDEFRDMVIEPALETFKNVYRDQDFGVRHVMDEFTSVCPKTGLPDFGVIIIEFTPTEFCVELKSLKLYLNAYRNIGAFMENSVQKIGTDLVAVLKPKHCRVVGQFKGRGGIKTESFFEYIHPQHVSKLPGVPGMPPKMPSN